MGMAGRVQRSMSRQHAARLPYKSFFSFSVMGGHDTGWSCYNARCYAFCFVLGHDAQPAFGVCVARMANVCPQLGPHVLMHAEMPVAVICSTKIVVPPRALEQK